MILMRRWMILRSTWNEIFAGYTTALWALDNKARLSETVKAIINDVSFSLCVSVISAWEIAIKVSIGKLDFPGGSRNFIEKMRCNGVELIDIQASHIELVENLPLIHRDPFDRLLVAAAKINNMTVLTADENIQKYNVLWMW